MINTIAKPIARTILRPLRGPITWACQSGLLPSEVNRFLPWRWALEPFTIYGLERRCKWYPTEFDAVGHRIFWSGLREWEKETAPVILDNIRNSNCFLDIGANCGIYTVMGCTVNPKVRVVAFEPTPSVYAALVNNVSSNGFSKRATCLNMALGDSNGAVPFHQAEDSTMSSLATDGYQGQQGKIIDVQCRTLDSLVEQLGIAPDFMKIDVEGFEHAVLSGAAMVLGRMRPRIVLEANPGDREDLVSEILVRNGYEFYLITDRGLERRNAIVAEEAFRNWLCVPAESNHND
jgi:FkbM family methyltransferase